jgi:uncharacterized membrane protein YbhN (UPF0104 family)
VRYVLRRLGGELRRHWVVAVGLLAVVTLLLAVQPARVAAVLTAADPVALALMLPCVLALYVVHGMAWWVALRGVGAPVTLRRAIGVTYISQAFVYLPGGDLWRVPVVSAESAGRVEAGAIAGTVIFDDLVFLFVLTFAMAPAAWATRVLLAPLGALLVPQLAIFAILLWARLYALLAGAVSRLGPARRFAPQLDLMGHSFRRLVTVRTAVPIVLLDAVAALLAIALFGLALRAVHAAAVGPSRVAFTYAFGQVGSGLTVLPAALGVYEGMMTGLMALQGVAPAAAAVAALLYRVFNDVLMAVVGLAVAVVSRNPPRTLPPGPRPSCVGGFRLSRGGAAAPRGSSRALRASAEPGGEPRPIPPGDTA